MDVRVQIVVAVGTLVGLVIVIDLVRRRRLLERYALLWMLSAAVLLLLAGWRSALDEVAALVGIADPPNALFLVAFGFVLVLLLHFSVAVSRLSDQTKILAQRLAITEERLRRAEERIDGDEAERPAARPSAPERETVR